MLQKKAIFLFKMAKVLTYAAPSAAPSAASSEIDGSS
jgi:hypothetical protein